VESVFEPAASGAPRTAPAIARARIALPLVLLLLTATVTSAASAFPSNVKVECNQAALEADPGSVAACLGKGPLLLDRATFSKSVDLANQTVKKLFICTHCKFLGGLDGANASFSREFDLAGSAIYGLDLDGVTFNGPVSLAHVVVSRGPQEPYGASFSYAVFANLANFDGARFCVTPALHEGGAKCSHTAAVGGASAGQGAGCGTRTPAVTFADARFFSATSFEGMSTYGDACFIAAEFVASPTGATSFVGASFFGEADFQGGSFDNQVDFSGAVFNGFATFDDANFAEGATFESATITCGMIDSSDGGASFDPVTAVGTLDFENAIFDDQENVCATDFFYLSGSVGALDLRNFTLRTNDNPALTTMNPPIQDQPPNFAIFHPVGTEPTRIGQLFMGLGELGLLYTEDTNGNPIPDPSGEEEAAQLIGATAKAVGDLGLTNDAHYKYEELRTSQFQWYRKIPAEVVYGGMMGYLVRPLNPIAAFLVLAALAACLRVGLVSRRRRKAAADHRPPAWAPPPDEPPPLSARERVKARLAIALITIDRLAHAYLDTLSSVAPGWAGGPGKDGSTLARVERFSYRFLLACALIALAASDPSLRQLVQAV
jgi:uncharacterized protein YjbI with pentapeptide repeats